MHDLKRQAALAALDFVVPNSIIGVGTGSTTNHFIDLLAERLGGRVAGAVASSEASAERLRARGVRVVPLEEVDDIPVYVDGADEFDPRLCLLKGGGGALTREKIVAAASRTFVCIVDASKRVETLGRFPLPVEVIPMARSLVAKKLREIGGQPAVREGFVTDNGNLVLDVAGLSITEPAALELELDAFPGIVTSGIFARRRADVVLMATVDGVVRLDGR